jgi:hypothetical protein
MTNFRSISLNVIASLSGWRGDPGHRRARDLEHVETAGLLRRFVPRNDSIVKRVALLALLFLPLSALAQSVRWDPPGGSLGFNQIGQLALVFEDCEPDGEPKLPTVDGIQFAGRPSQSSQTSIVNFKMSRTFSFIYPVRPTKRGSVTIPAFDIQTDKGPVKVAAARYTIGDAPVGNSGLSIDDISSAKLETTKKAVWAGEVFPLSYTLNVVRRYFHSLASNVDWPSAPAVVDDWTKPDPAEMLVGGERRVISVQNTRASIKQPGIYTLKPASQLVNLMVGTTAFGLFSQPNVEQRQIDSNALELTVKPLPPAPPDFSGAVGEFAFVSKVVPTSAGVGEPITWTLELTGTGNWPDVAGLPQREVSNDFQVVQPKSKRTMKEGTLFEGTLTEDVVLVPTHAGTYRLAPVRFSYFDPKSGTYKTIATEPVTLTITGAPAPAQPPASSGAPMQFSLAPANTPAAATLPAATPPVPPENLPRDPINSPDEGFVPLTVSSLLWVRLLALALLPLLPWVFLAAQRSRERDPQRRRREARAALLALITRMRTSGGQATLGAHLRSWQAEAIKLWEVPHAAPSAALVQSSVARFAPAAAPAWATLWSEADRGLHSRDADLPADWTARAEKAVQSAAVPGWNVLSLLAPRNLLPFLFVWLFAFAPLSLQAETPAEAYKRGDFAAASAAWARDVAAAPHDWTARHNLGLALAQQDRWAEATGHWASAALLNARADATRWDLALGLQRSGLANPELVELSRGEGPFRLARLASPGEWQLVLVGAAVLLALGLVVLLLQGYRKIGPWGAPVALGSTLVAVLLAAAATFSLHAYGPLAHPHAVFVWEATTLRSVPTDADTTQKITPLSAGSVAIVEKTFLGWSKLTFPGGQSGWVRTETLVPLYR